MAAHPNARQPRPYGTRMRLMRAAGGPDGIWPHPKPRQTRPDDKVPPPHRSRPVPLSPPKLYSPPSPPGGRSAIGGDEAAG